MRQGYHVTVDGREVTPFAIADLNDNDNVHDLCLDVAGKAERVRLDVALVVDPRGDLNPTTETTVR